MKTSTKILGTVILGWLLWPKKSSAIEKHTEVIPNTTPDTVIETNTIQYSETTPPKGFNKLTSDPSWKDTDRGIFFKSLVDHDNDVYWDGGDKFWFPKNHDDAVSMMMATGDDVNDRTNKMVEGSYDINTNIWTIKNP